MIRLLSVVLLAAMIATTSPAGAEPAADCAKDLLTTGEYAKLIRTLRDQYEIEIARLRAHVKLLESGGDATPSPPPTVAP